MAFTNVVATSPRAARFTPYARYIIMARYAADIIHAAIITLLRCCHAAFAAIRHAATSCC